MKPRENQNREIPEMGKSFDKNIFKRQVANLLRQNKFELVTQYTQESFLMFPQEASFILTEAEEMTKQRIAMLEIPNLKFDDYRTPEQSQTFYDGLSNEPSMREKMEDVQRVQKSLPPEDSTPPLDGPDVRRFG